VILSHPEFVAFHVKRHPPDFSVDPNHVARAVGLKLDAFLHNLDQPLAPQFADRIERFVDNIALWGSRMNLTAHPQDPEEIAFHVIDSLMPLVLAADPGNLLTRRFAQSIEVLDLGSGAGFPGLVLAAASDAHFTLVESRRKRASFLQIAAAEMALHNVAIESRRAEDLGFAGRFDLVTGRAFGDVSEFFNLATSALKSGGLAILYANPSQRLGPEVVRIPYHLERDGRRVERILAVRQQA
jgi:16S rRNA (guanine(527)-N(7))-methyltransferase RsmG